MKRLIDISGALLGLIFLCPVLFICSVVVRIKLGSPVVFSQIRPGKDAIVFKMYKFRTMTNERDEVGDLLPDRLRLTALGAFLRTTSFDELPELWNVLKGDMSLVGPRPLLMEYVPLYSEEQARRHKVKPGITGWAQVNGRNAISWEQKFELDVWYVDNQSLWLDIKILFLTVVKVFKRDGISSDQHVTMEKFKGSM